MIRPRLGPPLSGLKRIGRFTNVHTWATLRPVVMRQNAALHLQRRLLTCAGSASAFSSDDAHSQQAKHGPGQLPQGPGQDWGVQAPAADKFADAGVEPRKPTPKEMIGESYMYVLSMTQCFWSWCNRDSRITMCLAGLACLGSVILAVSAGIYWAMRPSASQLVSAKLLCV
jgi:hypothetical protein